ncbi:MAG TPA: M28 family metallopeptidase [Gemmatimonadales bacterium]|jgi:carboxypeptidase Q
MRTLRTAVAALSLALAAGPVAAQSLAATYRPVADSIINVALRDSSAWNRLAEMTDKFGNRLSGSDALERTIDWVIDQMRRDGLQNVRGEPAMVPHWVRGQESAELVSPRRAPLFMLGLGMSVGTPPAGIEAEVLVVTSFDDLTRRAAEARGKIVLFDVPYTGYGQTVRYRVAGPSAASKLGAVAVLIRSVAAYSIRSPHTGTLQYDSTAAPIPAAALSVEDAEMLHRMSDRGEHVVVHLTMGAQTLPDSPSRNVMGELVGRDRPNEVIVLGGHIDSWDVGMGAMDDGGGLVVSWEAVKLLKRLGLHPRRTIRVVGWTNEENGGRGGLAYRDAHSADLVDHILAFESDGGVFRPLGFGFTGSDSAMAMVRDIATLLRSIGADSVTRGGGGADIGPIAQLGVPAMSPNVDDRRYFWFHHSNGDTVDKLDAHEMAQCVAAFAVMMYVVADMPERLPRGPVPAVPAGR